MAKHRGALPPDFRDAQELHTLLRLAAAKRVLARSETGIKPTTVQPPTDFPDGEEAMERRSGEYRHRERTPPLVPRLKPGTFRYEDQYGQPEIDELREIDIDDPNVIFPEGEPPGSRKGWNATVEKYAKWIKAGSMPPPARGVEKGDGRVGIHDGHHRRAALRRTGRRKMLVWVGLTHNYPVEHEDGFVEMPRGVTQEQARQILVDAAKKKRHR